MGECTNVYEMPADERYYIYGRDYWYWDCKVCYAKENTAKSDGSEAYVFATCRECGVKSVMCLGDANIRGCE